MKNSIIGLNMNKLFALIIVFGLSVGVFLFYYSGLGFVNRLVVPEYDWVNVEINGVEYSFGKEQNSLYVMPYLSYREAQSRGIYSNSIPSPQEGETYPWLGINIKILEVHADRYVISLTSTD